MVSTAGGTATATSAYTYALGTPLSFEAIGEGGRAPSVFVTWSAVPGAWSYRLEKSSDGVRWFSVSTAGTTYRDDAVDPDTSYLYRACALGIRGEAGPYTTPDLATTVTFSDEPLSNTVVIKAAHINELRRAVRAVATLARLAGDIVFTDNPIVAGVTPIQFIHLYELRRTFADARRALGLPPFTYSDVRCETRCTVKAVHFNELRNAMH